MTPPKYDKEKNTVTSDLQQESTDEVKTEQVTSDDDVEVDEISDYNSAFGSFTSSTLSSMSAYTYSPSHEIEEFNDGGITFSRSSSSQTSISSFSRTQQQTRGRNWLFGKPTSISGTTKAANIGSILGRAGTVGLGKAVEVLDTLGSTISTSNISLGFVAGVRKGNKMNILAFEVANTIVKGFNLMQSLSKENVKRLKEVVLPSEGVQFLVSKDMDVLLRIIAADKREELKIFSGEVVRFGNHCKDCQWHNLDRYFEKLGSGLTPKYHQKGVYLVMQRLMILVRNTADLYHACFAMDRLDEDSADYQQKLREEENSDSVWNQFIELFELEFNRKLNRKYLKSLKKRSLWSKFFEVVMENLVDIVCFLHIEIHETFGAADVNGDNAVKGLGNLQRLGSAGLALHYANIIIQIDTLVSRSSSVPPNTGDVLYQGLPPTVKSALRAKLQSYDGSEELTVPQVKVEMEKTLRWLVPLANNTTKAHHCFGWFSEWAITGSEINRKRTGNADLLRIETLHYASKEETESYILDLVVRLHHLVGLSRACHGGIKSPIRSPIHFRSPTHDFCQQIYKERTILIKNDRLSKSGSHSPNSGHEKELFPPTRRTFTVPVADFETDRLKALDMIDGIDTLRSF